METPLVCTNMDNCSCDDCVDDRMWEIQLQTCNIAGEIVVEACNHFIKFCLKTPVRDSSLSGPQWVWEIWHGHERRFFQNMRMRKNALTQLIQALVSIDGLPTCPRHVPLEESMAIFLLIVGQGLTYPMVEERLQRSSETISNHFHIVLNAVCKLGVYIVRPNDPSFANDPPELVSNLIGWPYFKGCIGALDGTHIGMHIADNQKVPWINRKGQVTTNVLAVCDFNMCVTFATVGMEGSMHDSRVLSESIRHPGMTYPHPPVGKYYLGDAGYPLKFGLLTPYKRTRYHLPEFRANRNFASKKEQFNYRHSSLRSVIERTFGVIKKRWRVLHNMPIMSLDAQIKIIWACITLHNFIRCHDTDDTDMLGELPREDVELSSAYNTQAREWFNVPNEENNRMEAFRDNIKDSLP